ncbi:tetratricopeptide repeat protein [uncultured Sphingomonas sp.]|uniref:tetratricopeptide repeat protein n=1 Tax=uncultured Sphingomonas sp. TaxID=158754 RepID=UPI0035CC57D8
MRVSSVALAAALTLVCVSATLHGQRPDDQIDPRSMTWLAKGRSAQAAGDFQGATDALETAVAVDPRNRLAFDTLGQVADQSGLPGKAIGLYREALLLDPRDVVALKGQGEALVRKGAVNRARDDLVKLKAVCRSGSCPEATQLAAAIAKGPPIATAQATTTVAPQPTKD